MLPPQNEEDGGGVLVLDKGNSALIRAVNVWKTAILFMIYVFFVSSQFFTCGPVPRSINSCLNSVGVFIFIGVSGAVIRMKNFRSFGKPSLRT